MRDVLGPTLGKALRFYGEWTCNNPLIAKAIAMGDEFHQRNIAASLVFLKEMAPLITEMKDISEKDRYDVIKFLADTDQFFLNIMMATGKAVMDDARKGTDGTIVTAMCRNGYEFGIRIAGMGDEWFTGPVIHHRDCTLQDMMQMMLARIWETVLLQRHLVSVVWQ